MLRDHLIKQNLSNREAEVANLVSQGLSNKEVADRLFVTEKTVKFHLTNIYKKMNIKSRAQLIVWCLPRLDFQERQQRDQGQNFQAQQPNQQIGVGYGQIQQQAVNSQPVATHPTQNTISQEPAILPEGETNTRFDKDLGV